MPITRENYVAGLRAIADFYEAHPEVLLPVSPITEREDYTNYFCSRDEDFALAARALKPFVKVFPASDDKNAEFFIDREMAPGMFLRFRTARSRICRQITKVIPAHTVEVPERTELVWDCDESLLERSLVAANENGGEEAPTA